MSGGENRNLLGPRLGDQHPIERIAVQRWQRLQLGEVRDVDSEHRDAVLFHLFDNVLRGRTAPR